MNFRKILFLIVFLGFAVVTGCLKTSSAVTGNVRGKVFDSNGRALKGAKVEVYGMDRAVETDELGRYACYGLEPGQKRLVATYQGNSVVKVVDVPRGETLENVDFTFVVVDGLPPIITDVTVASLTENVAVITWVTSEPADSIVDYATGPIGLGTYTFQASDSALVINHSVALTSLLPGQTYHFRVRSRDYHGNEGISSDYQFTTPSGEPPSVPQAFVIAPPTEMERITLSWLTASETDLRGYNLYRSESKNGPFTRVNADPIAPAAVGSMTSYTDAGLKIAQKYYYYVKAVDTANNESKPSQILSVVTPGTLVENRTWTEEESPYVISGDIRIRGGCVLTIKPGVEVRFTRTDFMPDSNGATMTELIIQGGLNAIGAPNKRIVFTSAETFPTKASWGGIYFLATRQPENIMKYCTIMFADMGIKSDGSTPSIEEVEIGLCGIGMELGLSTALNIRYNTIRDCDIGLISANSNVRNNLFIKNQVGAAVFGADLFEHNTVDCLIGVQIQNGTPIIKNNIIAYTGPTNALYGIQQTQPTATPTISFNNIYRYQIAFDGVTVATDTGNIATDPLFIGGSPFDYRLQSVAGGYATDSPCLTAGEGGVQMGRYGP